MHGINLLTFAIGVFLSVHAYAEGGIFGGEAAVPAGMVIVEPSDVVESRTKGGGYELLPYLERRGRWGSIFGIGYSSYEPVRFVPTQTDGAILANGELPVFSDVYSKPEMPNLEFQINVKRNLPYGSLGGELGIGYYKNDADADLVVSTLTLIPVRLGATFFLDNLYRAPFVVPYASIGGYVIQFKEEGGANTTSGTTKVAPYANLGAQFQLDWLDSRSSRQAYLDSGLQSTFVFAEVRKLMKSSSADDPDLSNTYSFAGGLRTEF